MVKDNKDTTLISSKQEAINLAKSTPNLARTVDEAEDPDDNVGDGGFFDYTKKRTDGPRMTTERRPAVSKKVMAPNRALQQK